ncbi:MAG: NFACT family protein, partial [Nanoarchaeota archaeon]
MVKQLSSLDMHFLLKELKGLENSRVDRIYNSGKEEAYIQLHKANVGKSILRVILGKAIFLASEKSIDETPSGFCMLLRKHLEGKFLDSIEQLEPERILKLAFKSKEESKIIYIEFFGKGNIILCNQDGIILDSLIHHQFKDRNVAPKEKYLYPIMAYNFFNITEKNLSDLFKNSKKDKIVTSLAVELGLGGIYSEEICMLLEIDKNIKPADFPQQK